jgi:type III pantothenate kinase
MNTLLVDIGNTRVKWALLRGARFVPGQPIAHGGEADAVAALMKRVKGVDRVLAVSVAGRRLDQALVRESRARFGARVEFVKSSRRAGGVMNGYKDVWRLGADRWVGAIGAHAVARGRDVLFAMAGTALTIDLVSAAGKHRGGAIVPGPATMVASLLSGTNGIRRRAQGLAASSRSLFAADTASALAAGSRFAAAAFIDRAVDEAARTLHAKPLLLLSGGGAAELRRHLRHRAKEVPDLVLRGLAELARAAPGT